MAKDYSKRKKTNTRSPRKKTVAKKPMSPFLVFISGMLLTLIGVLIFLAIKQPELLKQFTQNWWPKQQQLVTKDNSASQTETPQTNQQGQETQLDYHQILTNKELSVEKETSTATSNRKYIMQCGASKVLARAETLKAELAFLGLQANISEKNGWHRVQLGPYSNKRAAERDKHKLENNNYNDCRIW